MGRRTYKNQGSLRHPVRRSHLCRPLHNSLLHSLAGWLLLLSPCHTQADMPGNLIELSLEALMDIEVTSVAKKPQKKSEAAAAIFVITASDLRRWGVASIPDALRRVPGMQVARIDANKWAITARGFNSRFANKLLVLIDGRSVYTPLFAGVYWDTNLVMLEDVERIEVIRGPGGTLWGANAVNGVINIITKSARDTHGTLLAATAGNELERLVSARHGNSSDSGINYRIYATSRAYDNGHRTGGAHDGAEITQTGFRTDWQRSAMDNHTLQGDYYRGKSGQELSFPIPIIEDAETEGGNLLYRWTHTGNAGSSFSLQAYLDYVGRESAALFEDRHTIDLDFQHRFSWHDRHDLVWGLNYRHIMDDTDATQIFSLSPPERQVDLVTAFIQDEISLLDGHTRLTVGSKLEHNDYTGLEVQPSIRLAWLMQSGNTLWGAISRAVRTPARGEHDVSLLMPGMTISGSDAYISEDLTAYEIGLRRSLTDRISLDATAFYHNYDDLRTVEPTGPGTAEFANNMKGNTQGLEIDVRWQALPWLSFTASYTRLEIDLDLVNNSADIASLGAENASPENQANLWLTADVGNHVHIDAGLRYVGGLQNAGFTKTDSYLAFDTRLAWSPADNLELSLTGQNLFDSQHPEFNPDFIFSTPTEVERSLYVSVSWSFR